MKALAFSVPLASSTLIASTLTGLPAYSLCSLARVGISATQGPHQVAQRLTTSTWPLKSARDTALPSASRNGTAGGGVGVTAISFFIGPTARAAMFAPPPGLNEAPAVTYRAAATPITTAALIARVKPRPKPRFVPTPTPARAGSVSPFA